MGGHGGGIGGREAVKEDGMHNGVRGKNKGSGDGEMRAVKGT